MRTGIALIPDRQFNEQLVAIENKLNNTYNCTHKLSMEENLPHITLFQSNMLNNISYKRVVRNLAKNFKIFIPDGTLNMTDVSYITGGWYFWNCELTKNFSTFQKYAMEKCRPYLTGTPALTYEMDKAQKRSARRFGYAYGGDTFQPHITVTATDEENAKLLQQLQKELTPQSITIERVVAFTNDDGSLFQKIIAETYVNGDKT